jgi:hypothetical protein
MYYTDSHDKTLSDLAEQYGESIDNLSMETLMEAIYNERNASATDLLLDNESEETEES